MKTQNEINADNYATLPELRSYLRALQNGVVRKNNRPLTAAEISAEIKITEQKIAAAE